MSEERESPTLRYLKYALGEIGLVVVGILIALQINDWYQERLDRQTEREYLVSMQRDLAEDTREFRATIMGNTSLLDGLNETLTLLAEPRDDEDWRRDLYLHGLKHTYWFVVMEFSQQSPRSSAPRSTSAHPRELDVDVALR